MMGYAVLGAAVIMQLCLGATYSWSVYVASIKILTGLGQGTVQLPFSLFYFVFPMTMIFSGTVLLKKAPRFCAMTGGILFGSGWMLASLGKIHFFFTIAGIGLVAGIGAGLAYIVPLSTCMKWFPRHRGLVTGVAVAGFGGGAALVSQVAGMMMEKMDKTPFQVFMFMGIVFFILIACAGFIMRDPEIIIQPEKCAKEAEGIEKAKIQEKEGLAPPKTVPEILSTGTFRALYFAMFSGLAAGFAVNANLKELYSGSGAAAGVTAVSLFALANAAGRISWGMLFDRFKPERIVQLNLLTQALVLMSAPLLLHSRAGFYLFATLAGLNYGGVLVLYASSAAAVWGSAQMGQIYGWLFSANIPAALAPIFAGWCFDLQKSFTTPFFVIAGILILAVFLYETSTAKVS